MGCKRMPRVPGSYLALADGIGRYRAVVAQAVGRKRDTVDAWCRPQPEPSPQGCEGTGRPNPIDVLQKTIDNAEHPDAIKRFLADLWGCHLVPKAGTPHGELLCVKPSVLTTAAEKFATEVNRRKPLLTLGQVDDLADEIIDAVHALKLRYRDRQGRAAK